MKTNITLVFIAVVLLALSGCTTAYVCAGEHATKYHLNQNCKGLNSCKAAIKAVPLKKIKKEKDLCGFED
jgi:hypothetical protein